MNSKLKISFPLPCLGIHHADLLPSCLASMVLLFCLTFTPEVHANPKTTQSISLNEGWNAVWLEVNPVDSDGNPKSPESIFNSYTNVLSIATHFPEFGPMEFIQDPDENSFNNEQWGIWYRNDPAGKSNLKAVHGNRAYLIHTSDEVTLSLEGIVEFHYYTWVPDSYNLAGFGILSSDPPTFAQFFSGEANHILPSKIFEIENEEWVGINPSDRMKPGVAYWIFVHGHSDFQGPFRIDFEGTDLWDFGSQIQNQELLFANDWTGVLSLNIQRFNSDNGLDLIHLIREPGSFKETEDVAIVDFSVPGSDPSGLAIGESTIETLKIKRNWSSKVIQKQLYRVLSEDSRSYHWLPVSGELPRNRTTPNGTLQMASQGLWVGDVLFHRISRRVPDGEADPVLEPTTASPSARILLHVAADGSPSLVKAVTFMRDRTAEEGENPLVLVADPRKLAFFEGMERRDGVLVGKRMESTFYDLPRIIRPNRPLTQEFEQSSLEEKYHLTLPMEGGIGPGLFCSTSKGTVDPSEENSNGVLELDEWHRSNPFRHAFHPNHHTGYRIVREMEFLFDEADSTIARSIHDYGRKVLTGTYTEQLKGLVRVSEKISLQGRFVLRRVSENPELH